VSLNDIAADLGPLPESDENARLQRESFKALDGSGIDLLKAL